MIKVVELYEFLNVWMLVVEIYYLLEVESIYGSIWRLKGNYMYIFWWFYVLLNECIDCSVGRIFVFVVF